jgi:radical SAM superfamily enzyme YgiQ (UPF0313 family)
LAESDARTLTIAPEAGSQRLRDVIHKGVSEEALMEAAQRASGRFDHLKLYYMVGLPTELEEDIAALVELTLRVQAHFAGHLTASITPFVPKAHTPFQWAPMASQPTLEGRIAAIEDRLRPAGIEVRWESPSWSRIQGVLARGDERVGEALIHMRRPSRAGWQQACREIDLDPEEYLEGWPLQEALPWDFVDMGLPLSYLRRGMAAAVPSICAD